MAAHLSINERITPPNTWPRLLACSGIMSSDVSCWLSRTALEGRMTRGEVDEMVCDRPGSDRSEVQPHARARRVRRGDAGGAIVRRSLAERTRQCAPRLLADHRMIEPVDTVQRRQHRAHRPLAPRRVRDRDAGDHTR